MLQQEVWVLLAVDYEDVTVLGVFSTLALAQEAQRLCWEQYRALPDEARQWTGPHVLQHQQTLTWAAFVDAHPISSWVLNSLECPYVLPEEL